MFSIEILHLISNFNFKEDTLQAYRSVAYNYMYVRRGEAAASWRQAAGGAIVLFDPVLVHYK